MSRDPTDATAFVDDVRSATVDEPRAAALAQPHQLTDVERAELAWARAHPAGRVDILTDDHLALWNFDVGSAQLKSEHIDALRRFVAIAQLNGLGYEGSFSVSGYASTSGSSTENQRLSTARAEQAAAWLRRFGFRISNIDGQSEAAFGVGGEAMAHARRVEVIRQDPVAQPLPIPQLPESAPTGSSPPSTPTQEQSPIPGLRGGIEINEWFPDPPIVTPYVIFQFGLRATAYAVGTVGAGTITVTGRVGGRPPTIDYQRDITQALKAKFGLQTPGQDSPEWMARAGLRWNDVLILEDTHFGVEGGAEMNDRLLPGYCALNFDKQLFDISGVRFSVSGSVRVRFAPGLKLIALLAPAAPYLLGALVAVAWAVATTTLLAQSVQWAREAGLQRCRLWAARDGFAIRIAQELSNNTSEARARLDTWPRAGADPSVPPAVTEAYNKAGQEFTALRAANRYDARIGELRTRYATADPSFEGIRQAVFAAVGGYGEAGPPTLSLDQL